MILDVITAFLPFCRLLPETQQKGTAPFAVAQAAVSMLFLCCRRLFFFWVFVTQADENLA